MKGRYEGVLKVQCGLSSLGYGINMALQHGGLREGEPAPSENMRTWSPLNPTRWTFKVFFKDNLSGGQVLTRVMSAWGTIKQPASPGRGPEPDQVDLAKVMSE